MLSLRRYQEQAIEDTEAWLEQGPSFRRCAVVLPTGGGKTVVFAHSVKRTLARFPDKRVVILVHTDELARQTVDKLSQVAPELSVGVVKARENDVTADVIVASVQTLRNPKRMTQIRHVVRVIVDECDLAAAKSYMDILHYFGCFSETGEAKAVGFTATLYRTDGKIGTVWQDVAFSRDISWMIRKQFLIPPRGIAIEVPDLNLRNVKATKADFKDGELGEALAESLAPGLVAKSIMEHAADRKTLAFFPTVASSYVFAEAMEDAGIQAEVIHGGLSQTERTAILSRHKRGTVVVNCMLLTVGYDDPEVDCIVIGRPTKSKRLYVQIVGRGIRRDLSRPYEEQDCLLLDVVGANTNHDLRTMADLSEKPLDPEKAKSGRTLTELEDEFDAGEGVEEDGPVFYEGPVNVREFDPINMKKRTKVWHETADGVPFLPAGTDGYAFVIEWPEPGMWGVAWCTKHPSASFFVCPTHAADDVPNRERKGRCCQPKAVAMVKHCGSDSHEAMATAEDLAVDMGADSMNLANKRASWRRKTPSTGLINHASRLGVSLTGNAGEVSDRIDRIEGTRRIDPLVKKFVKGGQ